MTPPKPVEWAKVEKDSDGHDLSLVLTVCGTEIEWGIDRKRLDARAKAINLALSPLLARSALLDRAVEALGYYKEAWKEVVNHPHHLNTGCGVCIVDRGMMAHQVLKAYASLPKMPEQGKSEEEKG